ncbi:MAG: TatD family hydrolase, partial [Parachlamydiaceae bacterium]|nr:TatD family hydrolase [Parachlamydiaceae bacterium]
MIDSHAHLGSDELFEDIDEVLFRAKAAGISAIVNICTNPLTLERGLALRMKYPWIYNAAATTPHDVEKEGKEVFARIAYHAIKGDLHAIGETGLDYHYTHSSPEIQKQYLRRYLRLALECKLPVVIHCRDAFNDFFEILDQEYMIGGKHAPGVLHCFTGTVSEAEAVISRGWVLSLSGIVTFKKSDVLREVAKLVPLHQLLIETDAPYLAPQSHRGKPNEPAFIAETAALIADVKNITLEEVIKQTANNARKLFNL